MDATVIKPHTIYYETAAIDYPRTYEIFDRFPDAKCIEVDGHHEIDELYKDENNIEQWNRIKSGVLVLGVKKAIQARVNCRSTDFIAPSLANGCSLACSYCLSAGSMIATPSGQVPIEKIQNGDLVLAYDSSLGQLVEAHVLGTASREVEEVIEFEVDGATLSASFEHPILTKRGWIEAQHLTEDDRVLCHSMTYEKISKIRHVEGKQTVYNFHVPGPETYVANGIVTHNCYVARRKGYANPITTFVNIERIKKYLRGHLPRWKKKLGPKQFRPIDELQTDPINYTYDIGENCDISIDDLVSDNVKDIITFFRDEMLGGKASFATKFVNRQLLNYDPQRSTRIRFSLMPAHVARVVDVRTSKIEDRIAAICDFWEAGYEVHLNFSPIIIYDGWEDDYAELLQQVDAAIAGHSKADEIRKQLKCECIFLTHNEKLHDINMGWHPKAEEKYLWRYKDNEDGTNKYGLPVIQQRKLSQNGMVNLRYKNNVKKNGVTKFTQLISQHLPYCDIRYIF